MGYDHDLADRVRELLAGEDGLSEQRMFGGLAFLVDGNMAVAASSEGGLLVRVDPADADSLIDGDRVTPMVMRGREMRGWLLVAGPGPTALSELREWVARGTGYARSLPAKGRSR